MSFFGTIRPYWNGGDRSFTDQNAFGRFWLAVRHRPEARYWVSGVDGSTFGQPPPAYTPATHRIASRCVECSREFTDATDNKGTATHCQGCAAGEMSFHPSPKGPYTHCPAQGVHRFTVPGGRCNGCLRTREQLGLIPTHEMVA